LDGRLLRPRAHFYHCLARELTPTCEAEASSLLRGECLTEDDIHDEILESISVGLYLGHDSFEEEAVGVGGDAAGGVGEELFGEAVGEEVDAGDEVGLEVGDVLEGGAVGHGADGIDGEALEGFCGAVLEGLVDGVVVAPAADGIEVLEGEADGVDVLVATGTAGVGGVAVEEFADGGGAGGVGLDCGDVGWWWRCGLAEDVLEEPGAA